VTSAAKKAGAADHVDISLRAGWGVGALGVALLFNTYSTLLLFYLTNIAGVAAGVAGTLLAIAKAYDWATDVPMGILSDRTRSRFGRRRPWLLAGAVVCGGAFVMLFSTPAGGGVDGYRVVGWTLGIAAMAAMLGCFAATARARATKHVKTRQSARGQFATAIRNVHFLKLAAFKMLTLLATGVAQGSVLFFVTNILGHPQGVMLWYGLGYASVSLVSAPLWTRISRRVGKHNALILATFGFMLFVMWWWIAPPGEPVALLIARAMVLSFFAMGKLLLGMSLLPDVQEYDYLKNGLRCEGVFAGAYNMVEKTAFIAAPLVVGFILQMLGYESTANNQAVEQGATALTGIRVSIAAIPAVCNLLAGIILLRWTLTREHLAALRAKSEAS